MRCPNCDFDYPPDMRFCGMCGIRLKQICLGCHFANPLDYRFCGMCGLSLLPPPAQLPPAYENQDHSHSALPLAGERRLATVLVADVSRSTELLEQLGTEAWVKTMNHILQLMEAEIYRYGGEVDQFRGDGLVAFFGATSAHEDDPERAVLAGLAIQQSIQRHADKLQATDLPHLQVRIGINTGEIIVTAIGDSQQFREETAMGEGIMLAARMETSAAPGTVLVSDSTYRLVSSLFEWDALGELPIKGLSQPVAVYRPLAHLSEAEKQSGTRSETLSAPLIGRDVERQALEAHLAALYVGRGGIMLLTGDGGMGKSRLADDVRAQEQGKLLWLRGRCRSYDQSRPFSVWGDLLRKWLHMQPSTSDAETRDRLRQESVALWGDLFGEYYPYLATLLSLPLEEPFIEQVRCLDAEGLQHQLFTAVLGWVNRLAEQGPLVIAFSDAHWADASSLALLTYCLPVCEAHPLLWLVTYRHMRETAVWHFAQHVETEYPHRVTRLTFAPLTDEQSHELIDHLIGADVLSPRIKALVIEKADGNPYYVAELIETLIEQAVLVKDVTNGRWHATRAIDNLQLPDTLQNLFLSRIDILLPAEKQLLQMAATIGHVFWFNLLQHLAGDADIQPHLTALQRAQLVVERRRVPDLGMEYTFRSSLIRDAVYESLLSTQQTLYHEQIAAYLAPAERPTPPQYYGMLAYHYQRAGKQGEQLYYTLLAAKEAKDVYANTEAVTLYTQGLRLLDQMERETDNPDRLYAIRTRQFELLDGRREVHFLLGEFQAMDEDAKRLLALARQLGDDPVWLIDALLIQSVVHDWRTETELQKGQALAEEALQLARQQGDQQREMLSLMAIANQQSYGRVNPASLDIAQEALALAKQLDDPYREAEILLAISRFYNWSNEPEQAIAFLEKARPLCEALNNKVAEVTLLGQIGLQFERTGDYYRLLTQYQQPRLKISQSINHRPLALEMRLGEGVIVGLQLGDYAAGMAMMREVAAQWSHDTPLVLLRMALMLSAMAEHEEALEKLEQAQQQLAQVVSRTLALGLHLAAAMIYNGAGGEAHWWQALEETARASQIVRENPMISRQYELAAACQAAVAQLALAKIASEQAARQRHLDWALASSQVALTIYELLGYVQILECASEEVLFWHGKALLANGRFADAHTFFHRAYAEMQRKHALIPSGVVYAQTFLEIPLHRQIRAAVFVPEKLVASEPEIW
ncbi:MAG: AAA family ATPase [Anaerolineales bacterium]|nr:AAA family ATPase [Anaerolineales bacterium]